MPVVFTKSAEGKIRYLELEPVKPIRERAEPDRIRYHEAGFVLNEYRPTFGGHFAARLASLAGYGNIEGVPVPTSSPAPAPAAAPAAAVAESAAPRLRDEAVFARIARRYAAARATHILDNRIDREAYLAVANDPEAAKDTRAADLVGAARLFAAMP